MEFVNRKDDIPYMKSKISQMFETTNQKTMFHEVNHLLMAGWWFQPLWKIWKLDWIIIIPIPTIVENKKSSKPLTRWGTRIYGTPTLKRPWRPTTTNNDQRRSTMAPLWRPGLELSARPPPTCLDMCSPRFNNSKWGRLTRLMMGLSWEYDSKIPWFSAKW